MSELEEQLRELVVSPVLEETGLGLSTETMKLLVNPSGRLLSADLLAMQVLLTQDYCRHLRW